LKVEAQNYNPGCAQGILVALPLPTVQDFLGIGYRDNMNRCELENGTRSQRD